MSTSSRIRWAVLAAIVLAVVALGVHLRAGVGWTIPPVIAKFVNFFLRLVKVKETPDHDGLYTPWSGYLCLTNAPLAPSAVARVGGTK